MQYIYNIHNDSQFIEEICIKMKTFLQMVTKNTDKLTTHQILMNKSNVESNKLKLNLKWVANSNVTAQVDLVPKSNRNIKASIASLKYNSQHMAWKSSKIKKNFFQKKIH